MSVHVCVPVCALCRHVKWPTPATGFSFNLVEY